MILQYIYKPILNFLYDRILHNINDKIRSTVMFFCFFIIFVVQFLTLYRSFGIFTSNVRDLIIIMLMGICILSSVDRKLEIQKWNKPLYALFVSVPIFIIIAGFDHYLGASYVVNALIVIMMGSCLYFVWANRSDYGKLFRVFSLAYLLFIVAVFIYSILNYPSFEDYLKINGDAYTIMGINPNGFAQILSPSIVACVYLILESKTIKESIIYGFMLGISLCFLWMSMSRAGQLCEALLVIAGAIILLNSEEYLKTVTKKRICTYLIFAIIMGIIVVNVSLNVISPITYKIFNPEMGQYSTVLENKHDGAETDTNTKKQEISPLQAAMQEGKVILGDNDVLAKVDLYSSGRIYLWGSYLDNMSLKGEYDENQYNAPHNIYIEFAYRAGIQTGIIWFIFNLLVIGITVYQVFLIKNKNLNFLILTAIMYFILTMLDNADLLVEKPCILFYYIGLAPIFFINNKK